jgi:hypothetical protein
MGFIDKKGKKGYIFDIPLFMAKMFNHSQCVGTTQFREHFCSKPAAPPSLLLPVKICTNCSILIMDLQSLKFSEI